MDYLKRMSKLDEIEKKRADKREKIKQSVKQKIQENKESVIQTQKQLAVEKAADVIRRFDAASKDNKHINMKKIRKAVLANLIERNKHLDPNKDYWSMQLLMKLGILPDVEDVTATAGSPLNSPGTKKGKKAVGSTPSLHPQGVSLLNNDGGLGLFDKELEQMALANF